MAKSVETNSPLTVKLQVRSLLVDEIKSGVYVANHRIPSERDLAEKYGVSRASVREAITELLSTGVLFRAGGRGTFVAQDPPPEIVPTQHFRQLGFWISSEIFHFVQSGYTRILTGVEEVCRAEGYALDFHSVNEDTESLDSLFPPHPRHPEAAAHIIAGGLRNATVERLQRLGKPLIVVDPLMRRKQQNIDCVRIDYAHGTRQAIQHLAELGHREIGFIGFASSEKYEAYWKALEEFQLPYLPRFVQFLDLPDVAPSMTVGFQCMNALLAAPDRPSAILVVNDYIALGALEALSIAGLTVPNDMSIVGFDDIGEGSVPLTTVRCDLVETGRAAARRLFEHLARPGMAAGELVLPVNLVVRRSTMQFVLAATGS